MTVRVSRYPAGNINWEPSDKVVMISCVAVGTNPPSHVKRGSLFDERPNVRKTRNVRIPAFQAKLRRWSATLDEAHGGDLSRPLVASCDPACPLRSRCLYEGLRDPGVARLRTPPE